MTGTPTSYKSRVQQAFSRQAGTYDLHAKFQAQVAEQSAQLLSSLQSRIAIADGDVLEIGCGTGLFTQKLVKLFPDRNITVSDISAEMLNTCKMRLSTQKSGAERIKFLQMDAEEIAEDPKYAVIASSFAIQWFFEPIIGISKLMSALSPGGLFIFSVPGDESCIEWREACDRAKVPFTRNPMPSLEQLKNFASRMGLEFRLRDNILAETHSDAASMMRSLKEIGANTQRNDMQLSSSQLRNLLRELDEQGKPLRASYQVIEGYFRKPY
ncbi:MAG: methyltransferase domain-containing protein [Candidatus Obscuribacterales bacterium]|nr:methyltransferase domain-containing protein [Candidatus Obscuribacterales bacterium]